MEKILKGTLCAAVAILAAMGATPAFADGLEKCVSKPAGELTVFEQRQCATLAGALSHLKTAFDQAQAAEAGKPPTPHCGPTLDGMTTEETRACIADDPRDFEERCYAAHPFFRGNCVQEISAWKAAHREPAKPVRGSGVVVCGPDHWVKDHWEPSCRLIR
jgi:hypothetical protein